MAALRPSEVVGRLGRPDVCAGEECWDGSVGCSLVVIRIFVVGIRSWRWWGEHGEVTGRPGLDDAVQYPLDGPRPEAIAARVVQPHDVEQWHSEFHGEVDEPLWVVVMPGHATYGDSGTAGKMGRPFVPMAASAVAPEILARAVPRRAIRAAPSSDASRTY